MEIDNQTKEAITNALKQLKDNSFSVRQDAAIRLGEIGFPHPQIVERLQTIALNDPSIDVRNAANRSLELIQPTQITSQLHPTPIYTQQAEQSPINDKVIIELLQKQNEILENLRVLIYKSTESKSETEYRLRTRIVDIDMSISSIANLMLKWFIASIPVGIILGVVFFILSACLAAGVGR